MERDQDPATDRDGLLDEALGLFYDAVGAGEAPDQTDFIRRHPDLAAELEAFFADEERLDRLTAPLRPVTQAEFALAVGAAPARPFGNYTLRYELGRGAMGVVYLAEQASPRRPVALKMIRDVRLAAPADVERFQNEAEAVAQLDHPHIVPVFEVAAHEGQPYFTMKYLGGGSLVQHLPRFAGDPRGAARLVAQVARAVHHAHQRGILHRDLKLSNILLDEEGRPHVTDFGLAKRLERDASLTHSGALVGTPNYMAPEQANGRKGAVTTATDVYGLGAILYALLAGKPPFQAAEVLDTLVQVRTREPEPPRRANGRVDRDLETVCLKCLEKDPAKRYRSAEALADDLERWLAGESVRARPVGPFARFWRWCRRNRVVAGLSALIGVLLFLVVIGSAVAVYVVWQERQQTLAALDQAQKNAARSQQNLTRSIRGMTGQLLALYDQKFSGLPNIDKVRLALTDHARQFLLADYDAQDADPAVRLEIGHALVHIGIMYTSQGAYAPACQCYEGAVAIHQELTDRSPENSDYWIGLSDSRMPLGEVLWHTGRAEAAVEVYRRAADGFRRALSLARTPRTANHYGWMLATCPDPRFRDPAQAVELAKYTVECLPDRRAVWNSLGVAQYRAGHWDECIRALERSLQLRAGRDVLEEDVTDPLFLAMAHWQRGDREKARERYNEGARNVAVHEGASGPSIAKRVFAEAKALLGIEDLTERKETPSAAK